MPCYEVRTMSVEFHARYRDLLEKALKESGFHDWHETQSNVFVVFGLGRLDLNEGKAEIGPYNQVKLNRLKQAYSKQALRRAAKLQGWQMKMKEGQMKGVMRR